MNDLKAIAEDRANVAAILEYLRGMPQRGDPEEQRVHQMAIRRAEQAYARLEEQFAKASATLTVAELAAMGLVA